MSGRGYSHNEILSMSSSFARALLDAGFEKGDVIGITLQNVPEYAAVLYGIWEAGLIASPINPSFTPGTSVFDVWHRL